MEVERLSAEELKYELVIRGADVPDTVQGRRKAFRNVSRLEKKGLLAYPEYPFKFEEDEVAVQALLTELKARVENLVGGKEAADFRKFSAKMAHDMGRVNQMEADTPIKLSTRIKFVSEFAKLEGEAQAKIKVNRRSSLNVSRFSELSVVQGDKTDSPSSSSCDVDSESEPTPRRHNIRSVPVFSGDLRKASLLSFLERVDELRVARNISKAQLFCSAVDLFDGTALIWQTVKIMSVVKISNMVLGINLYPLISKKNF